MLTGILYLTIGLLLYVASAYAMNVMTYSTFKEGFKTICWLAGTVLIIASFTSWAMGIGMLYPTISVWVLLISYWVVMATPVYMLSLWSLRKSRHFPRLHTLSTTT